MAYSKAQSRKVKQAVLSGDEQATVTLSATGTAVIELTGPASQVTMQSTGTLAYTYEISVNGQNFASPVSAAANAIVNYNTTNSAVVRITWVSGSGKVVLLAT